MDVSKLLAGFGALGFAAVFQVAGVAMGRAVVPRMRKAKLREIPGLLFALAFACFFACGPLAMVHEIAGWPGLAAQLVVLGTLVAFVAIPHPPEAKQAAVARPAAVVRPGRWRRLASALPAFVVAAGYVAALLGGSVLGMTRGTLCHLVGTEFLVIHSFPFLSAITLPRIGWRRWRVFQWFLFVTWSCLYLGFAARGDHAWSGIIGFASGAIATYLGFLLRWNAGGRVAALAKRWIGSFVFLIAAAMVTGSRSWQESSTTLWHGALYFTAVGLAEAAGLYDLAWKPALARLKGRRRVRAARAKPRRAEPVDAVGR